MGFMVQGPGKVKDSKKDGKNKGIPAGSLCGSKVTIVSPTPISASIPHSRTKTDFLRFVITNVLIERESNTKHDSIRIWIFRIFVRLYDSNNASRTPRKGYPKLDKCFSWPPISPTILFSSRETDYFLRLTNHLFHLHNLGLPIRRVLLFPALVR